MLTVDRNSAGGLEMIDDFVIPSGGQWRVVVREFFGDAAGYQLALERAEDVGRCPPHLTAIILTRNEAAHIVACIESLSWADAVVVFDSMSTDDTVTLAEQVGGHGLPTAVR